jgi:hypothetical protein
MVANIGIPVPDLEANSKKYAVELNRAGDKVKVSLAQDRTSGTHAGVGQLAVVLDSLRPQVGQPQVIFPGELLPQVSCMPQRFTWLMLAFKLLHVVCWNQVHPVVCSVGTR